MPDVNVNVAWLKQETSYYCGPAVAQMMLTRLGGAVPALPPSWQDQLWEVVKNKTAATRPSGAPPGTATSPQFVNQKCEQCSGQWACWSATPQVLEHILGTYQTVANYSVSSPADQKAATALILDTLDRQLPALALVRGWQHWLVVEGYRFNETGSVVVGGRNFNGVYVRDPWALQTVHYIRRQKWFSAYMDVVPCGDFHGKVVVLGGVRTVIVPRPPSPPVTPPPRKKPGR